jgi:hypothetical protein
LGLIDILAKAFDHVLTAGLRIFLAAMNAIENALRGPLQSIGIHGSLQTLILMMIPILTIVAVVKLFGGIFRFVFLVVLVLVLAHVTWSLIYGTNTVVP